MTKRKLFESQEQRDAHGVATFLHELADKIEGGQVVLMGGTEEVALDIPTWIDVSVTAREKDKKQGTRLTLQIKLKWTTGEKEHPRLTLG